MSNIYRNLFKHAPSWDNNYGISNRDSSEVALEHLGAILGLSEDNRQIRYAFGLTGTRAYQMHNPEPSLLGHVSNAFNISHHENQLIRDSLHQLRFDIESAFGSGIATHFKSKFYSHLITSTTPTKKDLIQFFQDHQLMNQLPPISTEAEIVENANSGFLAEANIGVSGAELVHIEATPIHTEPLVIAEPINNPADPHFGHDTPPEPPPLPVVEIQDDQIVTDG